MPNRSYADHCLKSTQLLFPSTVESHSCSVLAELIAEVCGRGSSKSREWLGAALTTCAFGVKTMLVAVLSSKSSSRTFKKPWKMLVRDCVVVLKISYRHL